MNGRLDGKVIVIVGGTAGLGVSAAKACVAEGAKVVVVGRSPESAHAAVARLGDSSQAVVGDAVEPDTAQHAIAAAIERFGGFHGLYHVAGGSGRKWGDGPLHEITDAGWRQTLELNLTAIFHSNRAAVQQFLRQDSAGTVLNMGSVLADSPSPRHFATHTYATSKAAVVGMTLAAAAYYADRNIRFNVIEPALVETQLTRRAMSEPETMRYVATKQPLDGGRIGRPEDLDAAVVYFLSDQSQFVTGQVLKVDGGWSITEGQDK